MNMSKIFAQNLPVVASKQSDTLSQHCLAFLALLLYIVFDVNNLNLDINIRNIKLSILLYADDIVLLSDTEEGLQTMLNTAYA